MIKQTTIDQISEIDIVEVVGSYMDIRKAGITYKARCPFHDEKTPSFSVSPNKGVAHCFGCGWHGNAIKFVQDYEKIPFPEAVETLGDRYGVEIEYERGNSNVKKLDLDKLEILNDLFIETLHKKEFAYNYLIERGVKPETIKKFKLGYAPSSYEILSYLNDKRIPYKEMEELGVLAIDDRGSYYSRFTERVMFPIFSPNGKIIAFGGRTLGDHPAKYINSPSTSIFNKSKTLYGYNFAKMNLIREREVTLVEGYLDVIMLHQVGVETAVAPLGTALTSDHIPLLKRGVDKVTLAFDGDRAGVEATLKGVDILLSTNLEIRVAPFESGLDPADLVKDGDIESLFKQFKNSRNALHFYIDKIVSNYDISNPFQKNSAKNEINERLLSKLNGILRDDMLFYTDKSLQVTTPEFSFKKSKVKINERDTSKNFFGLGELSIIRTLLENRELIEMIREELNENDFIHYGDYYHKIMKGEFEDSKLQGVTMMNCNIFSHEDLKIEILNQKIRRVIQTRKSLIGDINLSLKEKSTSLREAQHLLISLKKERDRLELER
jgi:DNA primase